MARFHGVIGYGDNIETKPGVWQDVIIERKYTGDVLQNNRKQDVGDEVNDSISVSNRISILADAYAYEHFFNMRYIRWAGVLWKVSDVDVQRPRLILRLGGVYNGKKGAIASSA